VRAALSSLSVLSNANRLRRFTAPELPHNVVVSATNPVVEIGRDQDKEKPMHEQTPTVTDPVCGMTVDPATAATSIEHEGQTYHFCAKGCAKTFTANPGAYLKSASAS